MVENNLTIIEIYILRKFIIFECSLSKFTEAYKLKLISKYLQF